MKITITVELEVEELKAALEKHGGGLPTVDFEAFHLWTKLHPDGGVCCSKCGEKYTPAKTHAANCPGKTSTP